MTVSVEHKRGFFKKGAFRVPEPDDARFTWKDIPKSIWTFLGEDKLRFVLSNIILFSVFFYELIPPIVMGRVVDFFTHYRPGNSLQTFYIYAAFLGISFAIIAIIRLKSKTILTKIGINARSRARANGFERLMDASIEWHSKENTGNKVQRILTGGQALFELIKLISGNVYYIFVTFIGVSIFFLFTNWIFFIFLLIYEAIFLWIMFAYNKKIETLSLQSDQAIERASGTYFEGTSNILSIKAVGSEKHVHSQVKNNETKIRELQFAVADTNNTKWRLFQIWSGCAYGALLLLIGWQVLVGGISIGLILVIDTYFNKLRQAAYDMNDISTALVGFKVDLGRLMPIFREKSKVRSGTKAFPKIWNALSLVDASFLYPNRQTGLSDVNLMIPAGTRIGIAGISGSGKSTLIKIILGLYELQKGAFLIGDTNFYEISREQITKNIAVVLQETELFNLSMQENITMMRDLDPELLTRAIYIANLNEVIARLPDGLETTIGERGYNLSGGERQRIGIARAIYKNSPMLLLDEATSSLDSQTEKHIIDRLFHELETEKTFIIVAHRLSTLKNADRIIVFEDGKIVEEDNFQNLLEQHGSRLSKLYSLQNTKG